ncbi:MAG TPA: hypothetical protein VK120_01080 [Sporosarcina sp.]|nr:hypothetical protein [Sporosarcina sp.]
MIRTELQQWQKATRRLLTLLQQVTEENRDDTITQLNQLLTVRDQLQPAIKQPFTDAEQEFGEEVIQLEKALQVALQSFFKTIRDDLQVTNAKRAHMKNYMNPYRNVMQDGAYYDTKQ